MSQFNNEESGLMEPPRYDMITVKFRGDDHTITLPYCEVVNGTISDVNPEAVMVFIINKEGVKEEVKMTYSDFIAVVEGTFDLKELTQLTVQPAGSFDQTKIL